MPIWIVHCAGYTAYSTRYSTSDFGTLTFLVITNSYKSEYDPNQSNRQIEQLVNNQHQPWSFPFPFLSFSFRSDAANNHLRGVNQISMASTEARKLSLWSLWNLSAIPLATLARPASFPALASLWTLWILWNLWSPESKMSKRVQWLDGAGLGFFKKNCIVISSKICSSPLEKQQTSTRCKTVEF
jgi:hypothetical protein